MLDAYGYRLVKILPLMAVFTSNSPVKVAMLNVVERRLNGTNTDGLLERETPCMFSVGEHRGKYPTNVPDPFPEPFQT